MLEIPQSCGAKFRSKCYLQRGDQKVSGKFNVSDFGHLLPVASSHPIHPSLYFSAEWGLKCSCGCCGRLPSSRSLVVITVAVHVLCDTGCTEAEISFAVFCMLFRNSSPKAEGGLMGFVAGLLIQGKEFCSFEVEIEYGHLNE